MKAKTKNRPQPLKTAATAAGPAASVIEQSVERLRRMIMAGELRPGQKLVEADLGEHLQISRASLREVTRIMERERLIELIPNRGPSVAKLGWKEIEEVHDVWAMLTGEAVYRFVERARPEDIAALKASVNDLAAALKTDDALAQLAATNSLFTVILKQCGNAVLFDIVLTLVSRLNFLRAQALRYEGWGYLCLHEIGELVAAIETKNAFASREATRRHIDSACAAAKQVALLPAEALPERPGRRGRSAMA